jgi:hypothetical protein
MNTKYLINIIFSSTRHRKEIACALQFVIPITFAQTFLFFIHTYIQVYIYGMERIQS